jgi:hypothetical protein
MKMIIQRAPLFLTMLLTVFLFACQQKGTDREEKGKAEEKNRLSCKPSDEGLPALEAMADTLGKPEWREMLLYTAELHEKSIHPPGKLNFPYDWEEIGPGYCYGPAFGHWDIIHQALDVLYAEPCHAWHQLMNNIHNQLDNGLIPGVIYFNDSLTEMRYSETFSHPPVWVMAADDFMVRHGYDGYVKPFYDALIAQIGWFNRNRFASETGEGYYYLDILTHDWESGVDYGIRFKNNARGKLACIDASAHVWLMYYTAAKWGTVLHQDVDSLLKRRDEIGTFINEKLWDEETGFYYDSWIIDKEHKPAAFEGMWPVIVGLATRGQADRLISEHVMNPDRFLAHHPVSTVGVNDPDFELRMWRGPAWNSMTYWVARGCMAYNKFHSARILLGKALDNSAAQFKRTGTIWEFYHPLEGGMPENVERKPESNYNVPSKDYLGHNPLIEMARLWEYIMNKGD